MDSVMETVYYDAQQREKGDPGLIVMDAGGEVRVILLKGTRMSVGREYPEAAADIRLESGIVSRRQGMFTYQDHFWQYQDTESKNGTFCNGILLYRTQRAVRLKNGDVLRVDSRDPRLRHESSVLMIYSERCRGQESWGVYQLAGQSAMIGRDENRCQILLSDRNVSKQHAEIGCIGGRYRIRDLQSFNGTFVNGVEVKGWTGLHDKDVIMICGVRLIYTNGTVVYSRERHGGVRAEIDIKRKQVPDRNRRFHKVSLLENIRMVIEPGEFVTILGGSGAGKSTLLGCINGFERAGVEGHVLINGIDLYQNYNKLKLIMGYVPQSDADLPAELTVYEHIRATAGLRMPGEKKEQISERVDKVIHDLMLFPKKNELIGKLSGGEKRRVSIAMELAADPMMIFMDEATSGLDPSSETEVMNISRRIAHEQNKIVLMITHNTKNFALCDKVIVLCKMNQVGRLAFFGTPDEALRRFEVDNINDAYEKLGKNPERYVK